MRSLPSFATFVLLLASIPVAAQHGGSHSGGGHSGFSGGHASGFSGHGGFGGGHSSGVMRSGSGVSRGFSHGTTFSQRNFSHGPFLHNGFRSSRRNFTLRNNCFGFGCRYFYPYAYGGYYDPYWWWDSSSFYNNSSYDQDYEQNRAIANEMNQQSLEEQRMLRQEEADGDQDAYGPPARSAAGPDAGYKRSNTVGEATIGEGQGTAIIPATVLVFRDQHQQEIRNYAIIGQTLWSFGSPRTEKILLANLDIPATIKANDDRGVSFRVPTGVEAQ